MRLIKPELNVLNSSDNNIANNINNRGDTDANNDGDADINVDDLSHVKCSDCEKLTAAILPISHRLEGKRFTGPTSMTVKVEPVVIRKTPKFPSRERHMAIRRKKCLSSIIEFDSSNSGTKNQIER